MSNHPDDPRRQQRAIRRELIGLALGGMAILYVASHWVRGDVDWLPEALAWVPRSLGELLFIALGVIAAAFLIEELREPWDIVRELEGRVERYEQAFKLYQEERDREIVRAVRRAEATIDQEGGRHSRSLGSRTLQSAMFTTLSGYSGDEGIPVAEAAAQVRVAAHRLVDDNTLLTAALEELIYNWLSKNAAA